MPDTAPVSKSERAYDHLHDRIVHHLYSPGYRLVLGSIADELGMSVVPVREAIRRLEAEGYVTFERNVGARVAVPDESEYVHTMQVLSLVEGSATAEAAAQVSDDDLAEARRINLQLRHLLERFDPYEFTRLNQRFHTVLFERCPNPQLLQVVRREWRRLPTVRDSTFAFIPDRASHSVDEHDHIIGLITEGADPLEIELYVRNHRLRTLDEFLSARHSKRANPDQVMKLPANQY